MMLIGLWIPEFPLTLLYIPIHCGQSPESIVQSFPLLTLEQVYGAIAFYLANRADIDAYLAAEETAFDAMSQPLQATARSCFV